MMSSSPNRGRRPWVWVLVAAAIIALPVLWYLGSPLFLNRTVNEQFPMSVGATIPEGMTRQQAEDTMLEASKVSSTATEPMPAGEAAATALARGAFTEVDAVHKAKGTATLYRLGQEVLLRLDPFESTNGPDLYVYLSGHPVPRSSAQLHEGGALEVARLKGNIGSQNYSLPANVDLSTYKSVVIYCRRFHVVFSTAELKAL
jgi:hypothetical protein